MARTETWNKAPKRKIEVEDELRRKREADMLRPGSDQSRLMTYLRRAEEEKVNTTQRNAMKLEGLNQAGTLANTDRAQRGQTKRTGMTEAGALARTGMTTNLGREQLGQTKLEQGRRFGLAEADQAKSQFDSLRDYKLKQAELDWKKKKFGQELGFDKEKHQGNLYSSIYDAEAGRADPYGEMQGSVGNRALESINNFQNRNTVPMESPDFSGSSFGQDEIDFLNQTMAPTQSTGLNNVGTGGNSNLISSVETIPGSINPRGNRTVYGQVPNNQVSNKQGINWSERTAPMRDIANSTANALQPVGNWITEGVKRRQKASLPIRESVGSFGERRFSNY